MKYSVYSELNQFGGSNFLYDLDDINQAIYNLLTTPKGSRIFLAYYGSNLEKILFELNDETTADLLYKDIIDAIQYFEGNRLTLNIGLSSVKRNPNAHEFLVNLVYQVKGLGDTYFNYSLGISP